MSDVPRNSFVLMLMLTAILPCSRVQAQSGPKQQARAEGAYTLPGERVKQSPGVQTNVDVRLPAAAGGAIGSAEANSAIAKAEGTVEHAIDILAVLFLLAFVVESVMRYFVQLLFALKLVPSVPTSRGGLSDKQTNSVGKKSWGPVEQWRLFKMESAFLLALVLLWVVRVRLFTQMGYHPKWRSVDWVLTALIVAGGTAAVRGLYDFFEDPNKKQEKSSTVNVAGEVSVTNEKKQTEES